MCWFGLLLCSHNIFSRAWSCINILETQYGIKCVNKQLLDEGFAISRIIKVSVSVISLSLWLQLITVTETLIIPDVTKTESNNCFIIHCFKENKDKRTMLKKRFDHIHATSLVNLTLLLEIMHCMCSLQIIH